MEIKNRRLTMLSMFGYYVQAIEFGEGPVESWPARIRDSFCSEWSAQRLCDPARAIACGHVCRLWAEGCSCQGRGPCERHAGFGLVPTVASGRACSLTAAPKTT